MVNWARHTALKKTLTAFFFLLSGTILTVVIIILIAYQNKYTEEKDTQTYQKLKKNILIGVNVDYDRLGYAGELIIGKYNLNLPKKMFWEQDNQLLLIEELYTQGFRNFRVNFKWNDLSENSTDVNFNSIEKILRFLESKEDISVHLCFGPYKNFSYPEQYTHPLVAEKYMHKTKINEITEQHPSYENAETYLTNVLEKLTSEYPLLVKKTKSIQTNNEAFHPFGTIPIRLSFDAEYKFIKLAEKYFPESRITFNTPLVSLPQRPDQFFIPDIQDTLAFLQYLEKKDPTLLYKTTVGVNYYASIGDGLEKSPFSDIDSITSAEIIANLNRNPTLSQFNTYTQNLSQKYRSDNVGFAIKIAELQEETWNDQFTGEEPGKSVRLSKKNMTRIISHYKNFIETSPMEIDIWGVERMAVYAYLNKSLSSKPSKFTEQAALNKAVVEYYLNEFKIK